MRVHFGLDEEVDVIRSVVTTGTFDGVHIGHQVIIKRINELAREVDGESILITFHPHPRKVLYPDTLGKDIKMINTQREKIAMLETTGLDRLVIMPFTKEFANTSSDEFIRKILVEKLRIKKSVVGFNHFFGFNKEGNYEQLTALGMELGFGVEEIPEQDIQNETVSSTKIRKAIQEGNIQRANAYLNHIYLMMGTMVEAGSLITEATQRTTFMMPAEEPEKLLPSEGMYAVRIKRPHLNIKAVAIRSDNLSGSDTMLLIAVDEDIPEGATDASLLFYKQLTDKADAANPGFRKIIDNTLTEADELIY